jgi:hypothetical protein
VIPHAFPLKPSLGIHGKKIELLSSFAHLALRHDTPPSSLLRLYLKKHLLQRSSFLDENFTTSSAPLKSLVLDFVSTT